MRKFKVIELVTIGAGEELRLTAAQIRPRAHNVEIVAPGAADEPSLVRAKVPLQFKKGEEIELRSAPKYLAHALEEIGGSGELQLGEGSVPSSAGGRRPASGRR